MIAHTDASGECRKAKKEACKKYLARAAGPDMKITEPHRNVLGIGIGPKLKEVGGKEAEVAPEAVRFYVERKLREVSEDHLLPRHVGGVPTDVIEVGRLRCSASTTRSIDSDHSDHSTDSTDSTVIRPGTSCGVKFGHCGDGATGTIGAIVAKGDKRYILSSAHVLARANGFLMGAPILCPGPVELPPLANERGHGPAHGSGIAHAMHSLPEESNFQRARLAGLVPLRLDKSNRMDAAIAEIISYDGFDSEVVDIGKLTSKTPAKAWKGMPVLKRGLATGLTRGRVVDIDFDGRVDFPFGPLKFENQILIQGDDESPFAWEGDSGSLVVT